MTGGWIPRRATGLIPGSRGRKTMQGQLVDRMRGRPLLLAEAFGIGPGELAWGCPYAGANTGGALNVRIRLLR